MFGTRSRWLAVAVGLLAFGLGFYLQQGSPTPPPETGEKTASDNSAGVETLTPDAECEANERLAAVRLWAEEGLEDVARQGCQEIIKNYPDTSAAAVARQLLADPQGLRIAQLQKGANPPKERDERELTWILIEQEDISPGEATASGAPWKLVAGDDGSQEVVIHRYRPVEDAPGWFLALVNQRDRDQIQGSDPNTSWRLVKGRGVRKRVFVRGYLRRDGTYARSHFRSPSGSNGHAGHGSSSHAGAGRSGHGSGGHGSAGHAGGGGHRR
jgi:hypothetical protein